MPGFDVHQPIGFNDEESLPDWLPKNLATYRVVRLSQSFVTSFLMCPRSAVAERRATYGEAAAAGIIAHAIADGRISSQAVDPDIDARFRQEKLDELGAAGWFPADPDAFHRDAAYKADLLTEVYLEKYHGQYAEVLTEQSGQLLYDVRSDSNTRVDFILVTGTTDLLLVSHDGRRIGVDWKTGSKMPEPWEVQRYGIQRRVYAPMFELDELHFEYPYALKPENNRKPNWVADRYKGVISCYSNADEREAFRQQIEEQFTPIAEALYQSTDYNDHHIGPSNWHCGVWCNVFLNHQCIGAQTELEWVRKQHEKYESGKAKGVVKIPLPPPKRERPAL